MSSIDTNDIKILVHSSFQILMKSCWLCLKDNPIICILLLAQLFFYVFIPSWFNLLFYTSPLVICTAIILQGKLHFLHQNIRTNKSDDENDKATKQTQISPRESAAQNRKMRPTIQAAMSRRTFKKRTDEEFGTILMADLQVDFITRGFSGEMPLKLREEKVSCGSDDPANSLPDCEKMGGAEKASDAVKIGAETQKDEAEKPSDAVKIDSEAQKDDKSESILVEGKQEHKPVVEQKKEDQKNHTDLGSSEIEWNTRIENLIAKRRARKMFNMLPQKNHMNSVAHDFQGHAVTPIKTERNHKDNEGGSGGQPGSAPSVLLPNNPFDLPYHPSEEKPVLTGDGFEEEFCITHPKDMHYCRHESFTYGPSFFTQHFEDPPYNPSIDPGLPRYRRQSDAGIYRKHESEKSSQESESLSQINEKIPHEVQLKNTQDNSHEKANISAQNLPASHEENASSNHENADSVSLESRDSTNEQEEGQTNALAMESVVSAEDETEMNPDSVKDGNDETSSSSSFEAHDDVASASADVVRAVKNETFRNSVKKVLGVIQKNRGTPPIPPSATNSSEDSTPRYAHPTKMEERSLYTRPTHHLSYSIASDMQVEVSDGPMSPTEVEALVLYKEEIDQNGVDSDEDSQGTPRETRSEQAECSELNLSNFHDTEIDSSNAEQEHTVKATDILNLDGHDQECVTQDTDLSSIRSSDDFVASPTQRLQDNKNNNSSPMVGSASTSTEQNIGTYINLPSSSSNVPNQDPHHQNSQASASSPSTSSHGSVLQDKITIDDVEGSISTRNSPSSVSPSTGDNQGSSPGSSSSPKSVLPETTAPVHELSSSRECSSDAPQDDHQMETPNDSQHDIIPLDEMALRSGSSTPSHVQPLETTPLRDLPLVEDEVSKEGSASLEKDSGEEKSHES